MTHVVLPDEAWATLADPKKVQERKRKPVLRALTAMSAYTSEHPDEKTPTAEALELMDAVSEASILAVVSEWSYPQPVNVDGVRDLPGDAFDELRDACSKLVKDLMPNFRVDPDPPRAPISGS